MNPTNTLAGMGDIRDIKGLEHFSYSPIYYAIPVLLLLVLAYLGWWLYKKRMARIKVETIPPPPPDEVALRKLGELKSDSQYESLGEKLFNFRLSEVFRDYLEGRFEFPASDMTTEEILTMLKKENQDPDMNTYTVKNILTETDKVKFAKFRPGKNVALGLVDSAVNFVEETHPHFQEDETEKEDITEKVEVK